ncbi:MAG: hypothetical protein WCJ30_21080, partial [Deltaproteobacteria bacterium]
TTHPTDDELQTWADGEASDATQGAAWGAHVAQCGACASRVEAVRALGESMRAWAEDVGSEGADTDLADRVMAAAKVPAATGAGEPARREPARVVPLRMQRWVWAAAPLALAAAAAMVFALSRPVRPRLPTGRGSGETADRGDARVPVPVAAEPTPLEDLAANVDPGSSVLSVDGPDDHSSYAVLEIHVKKFGTPVAVVWIDDRDDDGAGAVP